MPTGWLSRIDYSSSEFLSNDMLNWVGLDLRSWGGDVNGGSHRLSNVILDSPGGFATTLSPINLVPGLDGSSSILFQTNTAQPNQFANRWSLARDTAAETGGNAGSNLTISRYSDAGTLL